jgi:hypothetical protein
MQGVKTTLQSFQRSIDMTLSKIIRSLAVAASVTLTAGMVLAESPAAAIADGQPWNTVGPQGGAMTLTFYPDGQARAKVGMMGISMSWTPTDDGMCIAGGPQGERCVAFTRTDRGYQGIENGQVTMELSR